MQQKEELVEEVWDIRKIIVGIVVLISIGVGGYFVKENIGEFTGKKEEIMKSFSPQQRVKGAQTNRQSETFNSSKIPTLMMLVRLFSKK